MLNELIRWLALPIATITRIKTTIAGTASGLLNMGIRSVDLKRAKQVLCVDWKLALKFYKVLSGVGVAHTSIPQKLLHSLHEWDQAACVCRATGSPQFSSQLRPWNCCWGGMARRLSAICGWAMVGVWHCHRQLTSVFSLFQPLCRICDRGMTSNAIKVFTGDPSHRVSHLTLLTDSICILIQYSSQIKVCVIAISSADLQNPNAELRSHLEIFKNDSSLKPKSVILCSFEMISVIIDPFSECRSLSNIFITL